MDKDSKGVLIENIFPVLSIYRALDTDPVVNLFHTFVGINQISFAVMLAVKITSFFFFFLPRYHIAFRSLAENLHSRWEQKFIGVYKPMESYPRSYLEKTSLETSTFISFFNRIFKITRIRVKIKSLYAYF